MVGVTLPSVLAASEAGKRLLAVLLVIAVRAVPLAVALPGCQDAHPVFGVLALDGLASEWLTRLALEAVVTVINVFLFAANFIRKAVGAVDDTVTL